MNEPRALMWKVTLAERRNNLYRKEGYVNALDISSVIPFYSSSEEEESRSIIQMKGGDAFIVFGSPEEIISEIAEWVNSHGR